MPNVYVDGLLRLIEEHDPHTKRQKAEELWRGMTREHALPISLKDRAYFFYYGKAESVHLVGDWTFWQPAIPFNRIEHTDLFYTIQEFHPEVRLQYKLIVDGNWILDPSNPRMTEEGFGVNSEFWMSDYRDESWIKPPFEHVMPGSIRRAQLRSQTLRQNRQMFLYLPHADIHKYQKLPLLIVQDGEEALRIGRYHTILDNLIAAEKIDPLAAVFVPPFDRNFEYASHDRYLDFVGQEVVDFASREFKGAGVDLSENPADRCVNGASLGGLVSTKIAISYPETIGTAFIQSPSYWWNNGEIFRNPKLTNAERVNFVLQTGTICDARRLTQIMYHRLRGLGSNVHYQEFQQGHTWGNWRSNFATGIRNWMKAMHQHHMA